MPKIMFFATRYTRITSLRQIIKSKFPIFICLYPLIPESCKMQTNIRCRTFVIFPNTGSFTKNTLTSSAHLPVFITGSNHALCITVYRLKHYSCMLFLHFITGNRLYFTAENFFLITFYGKLVSLLLNTKPERQCGFHLYLSQLKISLTTFIPEGIPKRYSAWDSYADTIAFHNRKNVIIVTTISEI